MPLKDYYSSVALLRGCVVTLEFNGIQWNSTFLKSLSTLSFLDCFSDSAAADLTNYYS